MTDFQAITKRNARSVQTTIGWIFWDPGAALRYVSLGLPENVATPLGYIAARCAPLAPAGATAVTAAFGSISPLAIEAVFAILDGPQQFLQFWHARDAAVREGLDRFAPAIAGLLSSIGPELWDVVDQLPLEGRVLFGSIVDMDRPEDPILSGWHAINALREWRGDTHWAVLVAAGLSHAEASILHNAWMDYEGDWLANSRGTSPEALAAGWDALTERGLARGGVVTSDGRELRQHIEDETDQLTTLPWELLGEERSRWFAEEFEPPCALLLNRVDSTAGPNYQPASRVRPE